MEIELRVPNLDLPGVTCLAGEWLVPRHAEVRAGDRVLEIVAGEVLYELSAPVAGTLAKRLVRTDEPLATGQVVGCIVTLASS